MNATSLIGHITELLQLIENSKQPADRIASPFFRERKYLGASDRRFISEAVFGIIRHRRYLEALLEQYLIEYPVHPELDGRHHRFLVLYTIYVIAVETPDHFMTPSDSHWRTAFPNIELPPFVEWVSTHHTLDFLDVEPLVRIGVEYSFQDWMVQDWFEQVGDDVERLLQAFNAPSKITLRVNLLKATQEECWQRLSSEGIETTPTTISPSGLIAKKRFNINSSQAFKDGWFEMQDEGSQIISLIADPKPNDIVIDACSGAGGKSLHIAELMKDGGEIIAIDVDAKRLSSLELRSRRAGVRTIHTQLREHLHPENFLGKAELVLVDAPCSGVGTIRRNPGMKWNVSESLVDHYAKKQQDILSFNAQFVKSTGRLMYVTCSLFRRENEEVVDAFLARHPSFGREIENKQGQELGLTISNGTVKLYPHIHDTDGFFITMMRKNQ